MTEVRITPADGRHEKLMAYASMTFDDCFVVRDVRVVRGTRGLFTAMPSKRITGRCPSCGGKNALQARFCNDCGHGLPAWRPERNGVGRAKLHADIAHPITQECRSMIEDRVIAEVLRQFPGAEGAEVAVPEACGRAV